MRLEDVLELLHSLVRTLRENATVWVIMSGLLNRAIILRHHTVTALMVTDVVVVSVGCSVGVAVGKVVLQIAAVIYEAAEIVNGCG